MLHTILIMLLLSVAIGLIGFFSYIVSRHIKHSDYISSTHYGELVQLLQDKHELHRFGFGQYLKRSYSDFNAFHMSFMHMGMMVSLLFLCHYIFNQVSITYALIIFLVVSIFYILTSITNARLLSGQPTAGGLYHVLLRQVGSIWASFSGVLKIVAQAATAVFYNFIVIKLIILMLTPTFPQLNQTFFICLGIILCTVTQALIANLKSTLTRWMQGLGILLFWTLLISISLAVFIFIIPIGYSPFYFLIGEIVLLTSDQSNVVLAVALTLLILAKCFVGHDESSANAEETLEPKIKIPWATYLATSYSTVFGFVFLILVGIIYFNVTSATYISFNFEQWLQALLMLPNSVQLIVVLFLLLISYYNGLFSIINGSRHIMAMGRDVLLPLSNKLANITLVRQTPHYAILFFTILITCLSLSLNLYESLSLFIIHLLAIIVSGYSAIYAITQFLTLFKHESTSIWTFNRGAKLVHIISTIFNVIMTTVAVYFLSWQWVTIILSLALLNMLYAYLKLGYVKLNLKKALNKQDIELERNFPLQ